MSNNPDTDDEILDVKLNKHYSLQQLEMEVASAKLKKNKELYGLLLPEISFGINDGLLGPINQDAFGSQNIITTSLQWTIPLGSIFTHEDHKTQNNLYKLKMLEKQQVENNLKAEIIKGLFVMFSP